ncbi:head GIN domain-containing protein [Winogradskyella sp. Asnod2-B02-A]|uniref:head GIN domain-containing protein n=1 Tax=Winogradskyella sp. Asnod2-B02-A TaxID=3160583 RepID=UPI00386B06A9
MKNCFLFILFTLGLVVNAQESIDKTVGEFSTVKVYDLIHVKMIESDENKVVITGKNKKNVEVVNKNGKLKIRMNLKESYDGNDTVVMLYYTKVDKIDTNEGAKVTVNQSIKQYEIDLSAQEGSEINAILNTTYANFKAVTGGIINVSGNSKNQDISIFTGGSFNGKDFITEKTDVKINAAGEAYIHATESANIKIKAGGNVYVYGKPKQVDESTVLGGRIKHM